MAIIVAMMILGLSAGCLVRSRRASRLCGIVKPRIGLIVTSMVWLLLFLLGLEVGCNEDITGNFHHLGVASLIIASGATAGSVLCSVWLWHRVRRNGTDIAAKDGRG